MPLGCDCHPAYSLNKLNLRTFSLPFDWLNTEPIEGLNFVISNIKSDFEYFLKDLYINNRGYVVSEKFPYAEFMHEKYLISSNEDKLKFLRRINRFNLETVGKVYFLYNLTSSALDSDTSLSSFNSSVLSFTALLKKDQKLYIYIRYDETEMENKEYCDKLIDLLNNNDKVHICKYIRQLEKYGIWGNEKEYPELFKKLSIIIKQTFPRIYFR